MSDSGHEAAKPECRLFRRCRAKPDMKQPGLPSRSHAIRELSIIQALDAAEAAPKNDKKPKP